MYARVLSGYLRGLDAEPVTVEVDLSLGLPAFTVVGLPDASVREAKERVRAAVINAGLPFPSRRITMNLAPAGTRKDGTQFDLSMAVGLLAASGHMDGRETERCAFLGELSLEGRINRINGILPLLIGLRASGVFQVILPRQNEREASNIGDMKIYTAEHLYEVVNHFQGKQQLPECRRALNLDVGNPAQPERDGRGPGLAEDYADVMGQERAKRALQIAAAASHNILMAGPPGSGKTMMARRFAGILPAMTRSEMLEVTKLYSIAGELAEDAGLVVERPFRSPHHTATAASIIGGGTIPRPGEVSLAHCGVLFLDELPEFRRQVLELLRQPMENEQVTISRVRGAVSYPSRMILLAAMNPCPCGFRGDPNQVCTCTEHQRKSYLSKLSGPLLDRIDLHVELFPVPYKELLQEEDFVKPASSAELRKEVETARAIQLERYQGEGILYNSQLTPELIKRYCPLDGKSKVLLESAFQRLGLSARAYGKIMKTARTIADLAGGEAIRKEHLAEALQYRGLERLINDR